jgi:hypothetical protein
MKHDEWSPAPHSTRNMSRLRESPTGKFIRRVASTHALAARIARAAASDWGAADARAPGATSAGGGGLTGGSTLPEKRGASPPFVGAGGAPAFTDGTGAHPASAPARNMAAASGLRSAFGFIAVSHRYVYTPIASNQMR